MTQQLAALREKIEVEEGKRSSLEAGLSRSTANKQLERERLDKLLAAQQDSMWDSVARLHLVNQMKAAHHELEQYKARLMLECGACNSTRQKLHNDLQELRGNIRVFARIRPIMDKEKAKGEDQARLTVSSDGLSLTLTTRSKKSVTGMQEVSDRYEYAFDRVFAAASTQHEIFDDISQLVQSALDGFNVAIFAYGQTGSGKTFTMEGPHAPPGAAPDHSSAARGVIPRSVDLVFEHIERHKPLGWTYRIQTSFLEIYNETVRDLLAAHNA
eukprot:Selendium_serpulae@DN4711_c0_g1_i2.p1